MAFLGGSFLIVLRIIAIWNRNRIAIAIAICAWSSNIAFFIHNIVQIHTRWAPTASICGILNPETTKLTIIGVLIADVGLLLMMLVGLLRLRVHSTMFALGQYLWKQGLIWLCVAIVSEVPPAVFDGLNLNYPFNLMFQTPALVMMTISATRMHHSLVDFASSEYYASCFLGSSLILTAGNIPVAWLSTSIQPGRGVEVAFHMSSKSEDRLPANMVQYDCGTDSQSQVRNIGNDLKSSIKKG
ncbi:hypothetical protein EI94DRAFT_1703428 [Lactarius quietus]|nr:hypothetical protein EI94DRAFT_1703428 [Lactarius quietus]